MPERGMYGKVEVSLCSAEGYLL